MNDVAVSGGGDTAVPVDTSPVHAPQPMSNGPEPRQEAQPEAAKTEGKPEGKPEPKAERRSIDDALKNAFAKAEQSVKDKETAKAPPKVEAKAEPARSEPQRGDDGKFQRSAEAPSQADGAPGVAEKAALSEAQRPEPPARFNPQGKADWEAAPDSVKSEVHRAIKELEDGHAKYKESAERYEKLRQYDDLAKQNGRELSASLGALKAFEDTMKSNPLAAIDMALREAGPRKTDGTPLTINDIAAHVSGQSADQRVQAMQAEIHQLRTQIAQKEQEAALPQQVQEFFDKNPDAEGVAEKIAYLIRSGRSSSMQDAIEYIREFHPDLIKARPSPSNGTPAASPTPEPASNVGIPALASNAKPAGQKSISGAPLTGNGSTPAKSARKGATPSIDDALSRAFAAVAR